MDTGGQLIRATIHVCARVYMRSVYVSYVVYVSAVEGKQGGHFGRTLTHCQLPKCPPPSRARAPCRTAAA